MQKINTVASTLRVYCKQTGYRRRGMRELVVLQVGQAGNNCGTKVSGRNRIIVFFDFQAEQLNYRFWCIKLYIITRPVES